MRRRLLALASAGAFFFVMAAADTAAAFVSTGDGSWVWQSPLPQGNRINDVHVFDADHLLASATTGSCSKAPTAARRGSGGSGISTPTSRPSPSPMLRPG